MFIGNCIWNDVIIIHTNYDNEVRHWINHYNVKKYNHLTCATSPTTKSPIWICIASPFLITLNVCSPSIRSWRPRNCLSFDQSLNAVTTTTITTAIKMAAPSIQAWCSSSSGSSINWIIVGIEKCVHNQYWNWIGKFMKIRIQIKSLSVYQFAIK